MTSCPTTLAIGLALCLSACALDPNGSYVAQIERPEDAAILASGITTFVAAKLPAASTAIVLDATPADQAGNGLTPALAEALRRAGFAVADPTQAMSGIGHHLKYLVTPLDSGSLVRLVLDDRTAASRFFARSPSGELQAGGPFTVTQADASS
jgi:hypothetical protein